MSKMDNSRKLGDELVSKLGIKNCYFQPPGSEKITYPCIIFKFEGMPTLKADNIRYLKFHKYIVTYIHKDPGTEFTENFLEKFDYSYFDRRMMTNNLYHDVFTLYYK